MLKFFKNLRTKKMSQDEPSIKSEEVKEPISEIEEVKVLETEEGSIEPKFILKEDVKVMSIPCDHKNYLPQALLRIDKKLITDPTKVAVYVNLSHFDNVDSLEEGVIEYPEIENPCGTGTIQGQVYLEKVIIVAGVHYSLLLFDTVTQEKIYDGEIQFLTAYSLYKVLPLYTEVEIDPTKLEAVFTTTLSDPIDVPGVDYYLYTVEGNVELVYNE
ncbi:hypothetical protein TPELB_33710 [Terrisporobacter petrolearius]|uniref:SipL SPOCS domain-containing protein n=1 Tax=Terrisporobacter petrolearius TaxID=1460447 RepID=A0ABZ3FK36_9FIRM